jgi:transcriptional regulator with XRE-family HTH domain
MARKPTTGPGEFVAFGERLQKSISASKYATYNQIQLGKVFGGVTSATVSYWINGHKLPSTENCLIIADRLGVSLDWLLLGRSDAKSKEIRGGFEYIGDLPAEDQNMIKGFIGAKRLVAAT